MFYHISGGGVPDFGGQGQAATAQSQAQSAKTETELLRYDVERLLMITEALWGVLKEKFEYTDAELINRVLEIDKRDGKVDGRVAIGPPPLCPRCKRTLERKRPFCLYCGQVIARDPFER